MTFVDGGPYEASVIHSATFPSSTTPPVGHPSSGGELPGGYLYLHKDYLGSVLAISDANANILEQRSFDAWEGGALRKYPVGIFSERASLPRWHKLKVGNQLLQTEAEIVNYILQNGLILDRGYTGHEHLFAVGIIHMNGRLYDPALKRFLSPDNFVQDPYNTQNFNRYGYVLNNPLIYTDPSGEFIFGIIAVAIIAGNSSIGILAAGGLLLAAAILDKGVSNLAAGNPFHWGIGKAGAIGLASSALTFGIGDVFGSLGNIGKELFRAGAHGMAGGMFSVLQGGKFEHGFAAGFVSSLVSSGIQGLGTEKIGSLRIRSNLARNHESLYSALTIAAGGLSGGISAAITGGDFWKGATQGAIVAGLNHEWHRRKDGSYEKVGNRGGDKMDYLVDDDGKVIESRKVLTLNGEVAQREYGYKMAATSPALYDPSGDIFEAYAGGKISSALFSELLFSKYTAQWIIKNADWLNKGNWWRLGIEKTTGQMRFTVGANPKYSKYYDKVPKYLKPLNQYLRKLLPNDGHINFPNWKP